MRFWLAADLRSRGWRSRRGSGVINLFRHADRDRKVRASRRLVAKDYVRHPGRWAPRPTVIVLPASIQRGTCSGDRPSATKSMIVGVSKFAEDLADATIVSRIVSLQASRRGYLHRSPRPPDLPRRRSAECYRHSPVARPPASAALRVGGRRRGDEAGRRGKGDRHPQQYSGDDSWTADYLERVAFTGQIPAGSPAHGDATMMKYGVGQPVRRFEDSRLLTGRGRYQDD